MRRFGHGWIVLVAVAGLVGPRGPEARGESSMRRLSDAALRQVLLTAPNDDDREDAAEVLRKRAPTLENLKALLTALQRDPEKEVREEAAQSLRRIGSGIDFVRQALHQTWISDPSSRVRNEAGKLFKPLYRRSWFRQRDVDVYRTRYPHGCMLFYHSPSASYDYWRSPPGYTHWYVPGPYAHGCPPPNTGWH